MELWKEQIHRSQYLKDYYKGKGANHPVFGDRKDKPIGRCWKCKKEIPAARMIKSMVDGKVEYILCQDCYAKRTANKKMAGNRRTLDEGRTGRD